LLSRLLHDEAQHVRFSTTLAIYAMGPRARGLIPALLDNLKDKDHMVRGSAARALGQIGSDEERVLVALAAVLKKDPDPSARDHAAYALGYIGSPRSRPALEEVLKDGEERVREGAMSALERVKANERAP
jgi:HEAT repeat protein